MSTALNSPEVIVEAMGRGAGRRNAVTPGTSCDSALLGYDDSSADNPDAMETGDSGPQKEVCGNLALALFGLSERNEGLFFTYVDRAVLTLSLHPRRGSIWPPSKRPNRAR